MCAVCEGYNSLDCPCCGKDRSMICCPDCKGTGTLYYALDIRSNNSVQVTPNAYSLLPNTEDEAFAQGKRYCKWSIEKCDRCNGTGQIERY